MILTLFRLKIAPPYVMHKFDYIFRAEASRNAFLFIIWAVQFFRNYNYVGRGEQCSRLIWTWFIWILYQTQWTLNVHLQKLWEDFFITTVRTVFPDTSCSAQMLLAGSSLPIIFWNMSSFPTIFKYHYTPLFAIYKGLITISKKSRHSSRISASCRADHVIWIAPAFPSLSGVPCAVLLFRSVWPAWFSVPSASPASGIDCPTSRHGR